MILPLKELLEFNQNRYAVAVAAYKRANQLINNPRLIPPENKRKVVSTALCDIFDKKVNYNIVEEDKA